MQSLRALYNQMTVAGPRSMGGYLLFGGLWPLSCFYRLLIGLRSVLYRAGIKSGYRAAVPVISVGNLTVGGTGKTPMVDDLVKRLSARGVRCAIVSRGYGGSYSSLSARVSAGNGKLLMTAAQAGDEPYLLARRNPGVPVYVARRRAEGVRRAGQDGAEVIVLDDGFQHLAVRRDLDIVLLDAKTPFGNGHLLPAGILREPVAALQRSDLIVLTRADDRSTVRINQNIPVLACRHVLADTVTDLEGRQSTLGSLSKRRCLAVAGIARPAEFFRSLREAGFKELTELPLADHQEYTAEILKVLQKACHNHNLIITTEKDAVKLQGLNMPLPCYSVGIDLVFDECGSLEEAIHHLLEKNS